MGTHLHTFLIAGLAAGALSAALVCLLIFAIHRCVLLLRLRRSQQRPEYPLEEVPELESAASELRGIPIAVYKSGDNPREGDTGCPVCLADYVGGDEVRVLPRCQHVFHRECIDRWLVMGSQFCPVCRGRVLERPVTVAASTTEAERANGATVLQLHGIGLARQPLL